MFLTFLAIIAFIIYFCRIPQDIREKWDPDGSLEKPKIDFEVEWVYGYRGKEPSGGRNIFQVHNQ